MAVVYRDSSNRRISKSQAASTKGSTRSTGGSTTSAYTGGSSSGGSSSGGSSSPTLLYQSSYASAGITATEWNSMTPSARQKVKEYADAGQLWKAGSSSSLAKPLGGSQSSSAKSLTVVDRAGNPVTKYTAVTERFSVRDQAEARMRGVAGVGTYEQRSVYKDDVRESYFDFGTGKKVKIEDRGAVSGVPLLASSIEQVSGRGFQVSSEVVDRKESGVFGRGRVVTETTIVPTSKAQSQLLSKGSVGGLGDPAPVRYTVTETQLLPNKIDARVSPMMKSSLLGFTAQKVGVAGERLSGWAEAGLVRSEAVSAGRGAVRGSDGYYFDTSLSGFEGWKQRRYGELAGVGGFLQGAGGTVLREPSRFVAGAAIGAGFVLLTKGAGAGAGAIGGEGLLAAGGRQALLRTSQLATVTGVAATGVYGLDVAVRVDRAGSSTERGFILGEESVGLAGVGVGAKGAGGLIRGVQTTRAAFSTKSLVGKPLTEAGVSRVNRVAGESGSEVFVVGRRMKGVRVSEGAMSDQLGIRGLKEQSPVFGRTEVYPLGEAPVSADYYVASGTKTGAYKTYVPDGGAGGVISRVSSEPVSRVVSLGVVESAARGTKISGYDYPDLPSSVTGVRSTFRGEAVLRLSPVKGGLVRGVGTGVARDNPYYRAAGEWRILDRLRSEIVISEVSPVPRRGQSSVEGGGFVTGSGRSPSLFVSKPKSTAGFVTGSRELGGLARPDAGLPAYEFTLNGQRVKLLYDTWMPELAGQKGGAKVSGGSDAPFIVEGVQLGSSKFSGVGRASGRGVGLGAGLSSSFRVGRRADSVFGFGVGSSSLGSRSVSSERLAFSLGQGSSSLQGRFSRQLTGQAVDQVQQFDTVTKIDSMTDTVTIPVSRQDYTFKEPQPVIPEQPVFGGGGFALPFGGGRGGRGSGGARSPRFRSSYNPSIAAEVFGIRGSKASGLVAARTGIGVRPLV